MLNCMIYLLLGFHLCRPPLPPPQEWRPTPTPMVVDEATPVYEIFYFYDPDEVPILEADDEPPRPQCWWVATGGAICWIDGKPVKIP